MPEKRTYSRRTVKETPVVEEPVIEEVPVVEKPTKKKQEIGKVVNTSLLNVRDKAGINGKVIKTVNSGDEFPILGEEGDWYKIESGYVMKKYVEKK